MTDAINPEDEFVEKPDPVLLRPDLYEAAKANDTAAVNAFLDDEVPPDFKDETTGWTSLHWAAMHGNVAMVKGLLAAGASVYYSRASKIRAANKAAAAAAAIGTAAKANRNNSDAAAPVHETEGAEDYPVGEEKSSPRNNNSSSSNMNNTNANNIGSNGSVNQDPAEQIDQEEIDQLMPYLKNTPLLWASFKGYLRVVWLLLIDGYSPNDCDDMGNNALHLAAVNQHVKVLKVLVDDGGSANAVNFYKNRPIDMATKRQIREMLTEAMHEGASYTDTDVARRHDQNMKSYHKWCNALNSAIQEAKKIENPRLIFATINIPDIMRQLADALQDAEEWCLDEESCALANQLLTKLEAMQELIQDTTQLQRCLPLRTQREYIEYVHKLERSVEKAKVVGLDRVHLQGANDLIARCNVEYWVETMANRLRSVPIAKDCHEHDMNRLRAAIQKAEALKASQQIIDSAAVLHSRLHTELGLYRAMQAIPSVRLPMENAPEGYYQPCDTGHIEETEGYPLPPADTGVYVWVHSESYSGLASAIDALKKILNQSISNAKDAAEGSAANPALMQEAKEKLVKAEKDLKLLDAKDGADKIIATEAATKLAKKLKKKAPKKKKEG